MQQIDRQKSSEQFKKQKESYTNSQQDAKAQSQYNAYTEDIQNDNTNPRVKDKDNGKINYFLPGPSQEADMKANRKKLHSTYKGNLFKDIYKGIGCFDGVFSLQVKVNSKPYQVLSRCVAYAL